MPSAARPAKAGPRAGPAGAGPGGAPAGTRRAAAAGGGGQRRQVVHADPQRAAEHAGGSAVEGVQGAGVDHLAALLAHGTCGRAPAGR